MPNYQFNKFKGKGKGKGKFGKGIYVNENPDDDWAEGDAWSDDWYENLDDPLGARTRVLSSWPGQQGNYSDQTDGEGRKSAPSLQSQAGNVFVGLDGGKKGTLRVDSGGICLGLGFVAVLMWKSGNLTFGIGFAGSLGEEIHSEAGRDRG
eukprot:6679700-Heterocapsa_arctica.AAC.1